MAAPGKLLSRFQDLHLTVAPADVIGGFRRLLPVQRGLYRKWIIPFPDKLFAAVTGDDEGIELPVIFQYTASVDADDPAVPVNDGIGTAVIVNVEHHRPVSDNDPFAETPPLAAEVVHLHHITLSLLFQRDIGRDPAVNEDIVFCFQHGTVVYPSKNRYSDAVRAAVEQIGAHKVEYEMNDGYSYEGFDIEPIYYISQGEGYNITTENAIYFSGSRADDKSLELINGDSIVFYGCYSEISQMAFTPVYDVKKAAVSDKIRKNMFTEREYEKYCEQVNVVEYDGAVMIEIENGEK